MISFVCPYRLLLVRHGETDWNRVGRLQGSQEIALNDLGRRQAADVAPRLLELVADLCDVDFVCSPMERARQTMAILRATLALPPEEFRIEPRFQELSFGIWEGRTWHEVRAAERVLAQARERDKWGFVPPGGESYAMLAERIRPALAALTRESVIVSHGGIARAILALCGALPPAKAALAEIEQGRVLVVENGGARWV